ncbi:hypothetical protein HNP92_001220 [Methanococcus maripaludis]|uniref:DUF4357 domain-containing protein n=1 Tax=Methanococcus maripaludis TaxID=39152 RepID=A0A7J9S5J5_METMI|nr:GIY-YIG nuclease family protein [Methanococcus maripaludis]MBB6401915.1 hypothetical protein [Methanococcus maripaludis]
MIEMVDESREVSVTLISGLVRGIKKYDFVDSVFEAYLVPRGCCNDFKNLKNLKGKYPGMYILIGDMNDLGNYEAYIGYSEDITSRIANHNSKELFDWRRAACMISQKSLRKDYLACLERISLNRAKNANCILINSNENKTPLPTLTGSSTLNKLMKDVSEYIALMGYPILGEVDKESENLIYLSQNGEVLAKGEFLNDNVVVFEGSLVKMKENDSMAKKNRDLKENLIKNGILAPYGDFYIFTKDYAFSSPSAAACVIFGLNISGWIAWKDKDGTTLKDLFKFE